MIIQQPSPFFTAPGNDKRESRRRLLLISYHFPPGQAAGALRWQQMVRQAAEHGWGVDAVCLDPASLPSADCSRLNRLTPGTRVFGVPAPDPCLDRLERRVHQLRRRLRSAGAGISTAAVGGASQGEVRVASFSNAEVRARRLRAPRDWIRAYDAWRAHAHERAWSRAAHVLAERVARQGLYHAVVTCGPPHHVHEAGRQLARRMSLPHVVDMRDPWSLVERLPESVASPLTLRAAERLERGVVRDAALLVCNTDPARDALAAAYPERADRMIAVMNGFDDEPLPPPSGNGRFVLAYAGNIYLDRDPRGLFRAVALVTRELGLSPAEFGVEFMGDVHAYGGLSLEDLAGREGIGSYVRVHKPRPRSEAMEFLAGAAMLVSLPQDSHMAVPSKVFEYMRFPAWMLALADRGSATQRLLSDTNADVVEPDDTASIASAIRSRVAEFQVRGRPERGIAEPRFSRQAQATRFFSALDAVAAAIGEACHAQQAREGVVAQA